MSTTNNSPEDRFLDSLFIMAGQEPETEEQLIRELSSSRDHLTDEDKRALEELPADLANQIACGAGAYPFAADMRPEQLGQAPGFAEASSPALLKNEKQQLFFAGRRKVWLRRWAVAGSVSALATAAALMLAVLFSGNGTVVPSGPDNPKVSEGPADLPPVDLAENPSGKMQQKDKVAPRNDLEVAKMQHPYDLPMEDVPDLGSAPLHDLPVAVIAFEGD